MTNEGSSGILSKLSARQWFSKSKASLNERTKNHLTVRKKFLTSELRYGKLIKPPVRAANKEEACRADLRAEKV